METILISRTDNLGDVMLTLPVCGALKQKFPHLKIGFIGKAYTRALANACAHIDFFIDKADLTQHKTQLSDYKATTIVFIFPDKEIARLAARANIPVRIGTSHRWFHWLYGNKLLHFSRKESPLHEAQLNMKLLAPLGITEDISLQEIPSLYGFTARETPLPVTLSVKKIIIIHPKSKGSAKEWKLAYYFELIKKLNPNEYSVWVTGTSAEGEKIKKEMPHFFENGLATDLTGKLSLEQLIYFISKAHTLIACSTGPMHIAAALGINAIGIYPPMRPLHPGRWAPLGAKAKVFLC